MLYIIVYRWQLIHVHVYMIQKYMIFRKPVLWTTKKKRFNYKFYMIQVETHIPGGTRWNPTQEQIGILEMLYRGGMRTPNAQQIEQITAQLSKYGKIEGKNVFYWFQNHKARERQKQKRNNLGLAHSPRTTLTTSPPFSCCVITTMDTTKRVCIYTCLVSLCSSK